MTKAHGDAEAVAIVRAFRNRALQVLGPGDELVKTIGDAVMLRFPTPEAAIVALRKLLPRELVVHDAVLLPRAGAHNGRAVVVDGDYYGAAVTWPPASPVRPAAANCSSPRRPRSPRATSARS